MNYQVTVETECPECGGSIDWKVVRDGLGRPFYNGICFECNIVLKHRETPAIKKGRTLERNGEIGGVLVKDIGATDKRITCLPCDVQIGILRERHQNKLLEIENNV